MRRTTRPVPPPDPIAFPPWPIDDTVRDMRRFGMDAPSIRACILEHMTARVRPLGIAKISVGKAVLARFVERLDQAIADMEAR